MYHTGWGLDGLPIFGPFCIGGKQPTDVDECYTHSHEPYGLHYHSNFQPELGPAFMGCFKYRRAVQVFDYGETPAADTDSDIRSRQLMDNIKPNNNRNTRRLGQGITIQQVLTYPDEESLPDGIDFKCPATTYSDKHTTVERYAKYVTLPPEFDEKTCQDIDRVLH